LYGFHKPRGFWWVDNAVLRPPYTCVQGDHSDVIENRKNIGTTNQSVCVTAPTYSTLVVELLEREKPTSRTCNPAAYTSSLLQEDAKRKKNTPVSTHWEKNRE